MDKMLDSYLEQLGNRLRAKLPQDIVDEHVREIGDHLRESVDERVLAGESEQVATENALRRIGSDTLVADGLIYAHTGLAKMSVWRIAWVPAMIVFVFWGAPILALSAMDALGVILAWLILLPGAFATTFGLACVRSRRFVMAPIGAAMSLLLAMYCVQYQVTSTRLAAEQRANNLARAAQSPQRVQRLQSAIQTAASLQHDWTTGKVPGTLLAPTRVNSADWIASANHQRPTPNYLVVAANSAGEASKLWKQNGRRYVSELHLYLSAEHRSPAMEVESGLPPIGPAALAWAEGFGGVWSVLAGLNLLLIGIPRHRRTAASEQWRPAQLS